MRPLRYTYGRPAHGVCAVSIHRARAFALLSFVLLAGTPAPALFGAAHAQPAGLEYKYRASYKNTEYYLNQIEGNLDQVRSQVSVATAKDGPQAQANIDALRKSLTNAKSNLSKLPAPSELALTQPLHDRVAAAEQAINALQVTLDERIKGTRAAVNAEAAAIAADTDKLIEWGKMFADAEGAFNNEPEAALMLVERMADVESEWQVIQQRRAALLDPANQGEEGRTIQAAAGYFQRSPPRFKEYMAMLARDLPAQIGEQQTRCAEAIARSVTGKDVALLAGTKVDLDRTGDRVRLRSGIDANAGAPVAAEQARIAALWTETSKTLRDDIIKGNQPPQPEYAGDDVPALRALALKRWAELHPKDTVLAVVFNTPGWKRTTRWDWHASSKSFNKVDYSSIQPKIIVQFDDTLALVVPVDITKDHLQGDLIRVSPWEREANPDPRNLLPIDRVRK